MCRLLNMEDAVDEIIHHLGIVQEGDDGQVRGHISFEDFMRCRLNLSNEIEHERLKLESGLVHCGMYSAAVDSLSGDVPLQTPDNSDISQGKNTEFSLAVSLLNTVWWSLSHLLAILKSQCAMIMLHVAIACVCQLALAYAPLLMVRLNSYYCRWTSHHHDRTRNICVTNNNHSD